MKSTPLLRAVARSFGIATSYRDQEGKNVFPSADILYALIRKLSCDPSLADEPDAESLRKLFTQRRKERLEQVIDRSLTFWDGKFPSLKIWLALKSGTLRFKFRDEQDRVAEHVFRLNECRAIRRDFRGKVRYRVHIEFTVIVPLGYHDLTVYLNDEKIAGSFVISAPLRLGTGDRQWGFFAPVYGLGSEKAAPVGTYDDLGEAMTLVKDKGGSFFGTLPLLPVDYEAGDTAPYSAISRLFLNEIYLATEEETGGGELVDYVSAYAEKKKALTEAAQDHFDEFPGGDAGFQEFARDHAHLRDYARFRAQAEVAERRERAEKFHLYCQYQCHLKLSGLKSRAENGEAASLYLDFPVGVNPKGFDAKTWPELFLDGLTVGAPSDMFSNDGQDWGVRPFHPANIEKNKFAYIRESLARFFAYARMIRLDHIMGYYRIYCFPDGRPAMEGSYIHYPFDSLLSVFCLEAHRHGASIIGEDIGLVPQKVREEMARHGLCRMWLLQAWIKKTPSETFQGFESDMLAGVNTHDMFPLEAFLKSEDIRVKHQLGIIDEQEKEEQLRERKDLLKAWDRNDFFLKAVERLAVSPARFLMLNIEDIWGETHPQNFPGGPADYPNWRRRLTRPVSEWDGEEMFQSAVKLLNECRKSS